MIPNVSAHTRELEKHSAGSRSCAKKSPKIISWASIFIVRRTRRKLRTTLLYPNRRDSPCGFDRQNQNQTKFVIFEYGTRATHDRGVKMQIRIYIKKNTSITAEAKLQVTPLPCTCVFSSTVLYLSPSESTFLSPPAPVALPMITRVHRMNCLHRSISMAAGTTCCDAQQAPQRRQKSREQRSPTHSCVPKKNLA